MLTLRKKQLKINLLLFQLHLGKRIIPIAFANTHTKKNYKCTYSKTKGMSLILNLILGPFCIPQQEKFCKSVLFASGPCGRPGLCVLFGCQIRASFLLSVGIQPIRRYAAYLIASVPYKMCILLFFKSLLKFQLMSKPRRIFYFCKSTVHYELSFRLSKSTL